MRKPMVAALLLSAALCWPTRAEQSTMFAVTGERTSARDMIGVHDGVLPEVQERIRMRFRDTYVGMSWVNIRGKINMFCEPDVALNGEFLIDMMRSYLERNPDDGGWPWQYVLLKSVIATFPCKQSK
jgi:hypothetical protein